MALPALPRSWSLGGIDFNVGEVAGVSRILNVPDWFSSAPGTPQLTRRVSGHGNYRGPNYLGPQTYSASGWLQVAQAGDRAAEMRRIAALCFGSDKLFAFTETDQAGQQLTAWCERADVVSVVPLGDGVTAKFAFELVAADPFKYSAPNPAQTTGLSTGALDGIRWNGTTAASAGTGTEWNGRKATPTGLQYQRSSGASNSLTLTNDGTADAPVTIAIVVGTPGLANTPTIMRVDTGEKITFGEVVPAGSVVVIDTLTGEVTLNGVDRGGSLLDDDFFVVPAESSIEVVCTALSGSSNVQFSLTNPNVYV